jgi:hypothetical protein
MATTFTVGSGDYIRPYRNVRIQHFPEAASQTFKRGEPLIMDSAGTENKVKIAGNQAVGLIVGIAAADASGVTGAMVPVWLATQNAEFIAVGKAAQAMDYTDLSVGLALLKDTVNVIWYIDNTDTTHDAVVPLQIRPPAVQGDFQGYYIFRFAIAATLYGGQTV